MTPAARVQAAIGVLDQVLAGRPAEAALTGWARGSRFAGSGDRAAVRDLVFDALRCLRSFTALAGASEPSGRALMIGKIRAEAADPVGLFTGAPYAPPLLSAEEQAALAAASDLDSLPDGVRFDWPDWLLDAVRLACGAEAPAVMAAQRQRAPVFLRVNRIKADRPAAIAALATDGIGAVPSDLAGTALMVVKNASKIKASRAYLDGLVELQDAASQAAVECLPLADEDWVLDYCAGGGGKALAMAARARLALVAHDADPARMRDLPARAARAGAAIACVDAKALQGRQFDLVLVDAPCSGSGTWRRTPDAKWRLTPARLQDLCRLQAEVLTAAAFHVGPGGRLAYMTCSILGCENEDQTTTFVAQNPGFRLDWQRRFSPVTGGDGFFAALLTRDR